MGIYAITGGTMGIGGAVKKKLEDQGDRVINIDLKDADIEADLSTHKGRKRAVDGVHELTDTLDGFVGVAGLGPHVKDYGLIVSVNYFGATEVIEGVKDILAQQKGKAVLISSNSAAMDGLNPELVAAMVDENDEEKATELANSLDGFNAYAGSKRALSCWARRNAPLWIRDGIRLNTVAPGSTQTPLLEGTLASKEFGKLTRSFPVPRGAIGQPDEIAEVVLFLLSEKASYCCGNVFFVDGGTDAMLRPNQF